MSNIINSILSNLGYALGPILLGLLLWASVKIKEHVSSRKKTKMLFSHMNKSVQLRQYLAELKAQTNADRAMVFLFHNGGKYINDSPCVKVSCLVEVCSSGISHECGNLQDIPVFYLPKSVIDIIIEQKGGVIDTSTLEDCVFKNMFLSIGVSKIAVTTLYQGSDVIGFVCLNYFHAEEPVDIFTINKYTGLISVTLSLKNIKLKAKRLV
ncbi:MAG: hypothetical protein WC942_01835 [Clostridia bacterium]|jgi:hypothetical protein